ncbi:Penicillin-binding protein activator LpoA [Burkholderiales bacterium]|nr:MAG: hypothetical protein F9K47_09235 [Burkholderiales bacterium]CAG0965596.1 Penicillin-binding protein activator LpoA [Burkholderiales bacterium]
MKRLAARLAVLLALALAAATPALCAEEDASATAGERPELRPSPKPMPRYALVLPLKVAAFKEPAEALRAGFLAAASAGAEPGGVTVVSHGENDAPAAFELAAAAGALVVVGPLTRGDVSSVLAARKAFPATLLLNAPERVQPLPEKVQILALSLEADARQLARLAWKDGRERVAVVAGDAAFHRRFVAAFSEAAEQLGMTIAHSAAFSGDTTLLPLLRQGIETANADALLLALDATEARLARGYLSALPAYAGGQVFDGRAATELVELANVRFVEMPWLVQPDHPAVMAYPRPDLEDATSQRLYALGIDAYRVASLLARGLDPGAIELDGVTGRISGRQGAVLVREANAMMVRQGEIVAIDAAK